MGLEKVWGQDPEVRNVFVQEFGFCVVTFCYNAVCSETFPYLTVLTILCVYFFFRIKHENIVALEDIYESPNHLYLVMQL